MKESQPQYYDARPERLFPCLGFVIHAPELLFHFRPSLELLVESSSWNPQGSKSFELVLLPSRDSSYAELERTVRDLGLQDLTLRHGHELLHNAWGYRCLVSNHFLGFWHCSHLGLRHQEPHQVFTPIRALGQFNVRQLYDLGADDWNFGRWNQFYDAFLGFGDWHRQQLQSFPGTYTPCGYGRYDSYFQETLSAQSRHKVLRLFGADPERDSIIYFSTLGQYFGALPWHAESLSTLCSDYNVIVKPHPFSRQREPKYLEALERFDFTHIIETPTDNVLLLQLADIMLADYGALSFDGFYTQQRLLLLDHPQHERYITSQSSDAQLRQQVPHIAPGNAQNLRQRLARLSEQDSLESHSLREHWFGPGDGKSALRCAKALIGLLR